jgi:bla regulator protein BlaR1
MHPYELPAILGRAVLASSLQASLFILVILAIRALVRERWSARWRASLWLLLVLAMLLPWRPGFRPDLALRLPATTGTGDAIRTVKPAPAVNPDGNLAATPVVVPAAKTTAGPAAVPAASPAAHVSAPTAVTTVVNPAVTLAASPAVTPAITPAVALTTTPLAAAATAPAPALAPFPAAGPARYGILRHYPLAGWLGLLWFGGAVALALRLLLAQFRLGRAVRQAQVLTSQASLDVLEQAKRELGIRTLLGVLVTDRVGGPALCGLIRPRLLLPPAVLAELSGAELRHVLLHELAHLQRRDIHWGWLCAWLQIIHWFNPLVWYAFHQLRGDRELACDEAAVAALGGPEAAAYGGTLIRLLELVAPGPVLPSLAGISEHPSLFRRRIATIARLAERGRAPGRPWTWLSAAAFVAIAGCGLGLRVQAGPPARLQAQLVDDIDFPFVDDPELVGGWRSVDFVPDPADFDPRHPRAIAADLYLKELYVRPNGRTNWAWTWTKGLFLHSGDHTASHYQIRRMEAKVYLFMEWKSGDYVYFHRKPRTYVFERDDRIVIPETRVVDRIDYPFVEDPAVHGSWVTVDFVSRPEQFQPGGRHWPGEPFLKELRFLDGGRTRLAFRDGQSSEVAWTSGLVLDPVDRTASRYQLRQLDGRTFLFFEWKSGDYTLRAQPPKYYVLERRG